MDKSSLAVSDKPKVDDELHYFASVICQTMQELEEEWSKNKYFLDTICKDERLCRVMETIDRWNMLFKKEKGSKK